MSKLIIFISAPYSIGDTEENITRAVLTAEELSQLGMQPHVEILVERWHKQHPHHHAFWVDRALNILERCDALLRLPGESVGCDEEVKFATENDIPVFYSIGELALAVRLHQIERRVI